MYYKYKVIVDYNEELKQAGAHFRFTNIEELSDFIELCFKTDEDRSEIIIQREDF